eukprot:gnl/Chilomastix_caulleri/6795.p1 GENE.gnl/Chilomastix_caulleri/6795~~gnl/Chilomastix_caulleri/6795.p1  ORF type:complete len:57 (-),score=5.28 gnl/Chilomastix_caulleri/6795:161-331(-)
MHFLVLFDFGINVHRLVFKAYTSIELADIIKSRVGISIFPPEALKLLTSRVGNWEW